MAIGDDFEIQGDGDIRAVAGTANYTVLELHRWLQGLADDAQAASDDFMDITAATPSERSTDNIVTLNAPFNINDATSQRLYDGSITQAGGDTVYAGIVVVGAVESGTQIQLWQDEAVYSSFWSTGINANAAASILTRMLVKVRQNGADIDQKKLIFWARELSDTYAEFSLTAALGNNVAALLTANDLNNQTDSATIDTWDDIVNTEGYQLFDISGNAVNEPYYSQWDKASRTANQLYERTKWIARRGSTEAIHSTTGPLFRGITHQFDYDGELQTFAEDAIIAWGTSFAYDGGTGTVPAAGQYWENLTTGGVGKVVHVSSGAGATGSVVLQREDPTSPTWVDPGNFSLLGGTGSIDINGAVTGNTNTGGSGRILALDDNGADGVIWLQLLSGGIGGNNYVIFQRGTTGAFADQNGAATARTVKPEFIGTFTGTAFIGAFGIGMKPSETAAADLFTDLVGSTWNPPNLQDFTVFGLISGDRVLVVNNQAGAPDFDQLILNTTLSGGAETQLVVTAAIPADTPTAGSLRVQLDTGVYRYVEYDSWSGSTFQLDAAYQNWADPLDATAPKNVFIGYIDKATATTEETVTLVFSGARTMFVRVRDGGVTPIKTFETTASFGTGGGSATAIRTSDA